MKNSKPEGLARIQAGGKRSATPAIRYITEKGRQNHPAMCILSQVLPPLRGFGCSRSSMQGLYPCLWSVSPSGFIGVNQPVRKDSFAMLRMGGRILPLCATCPKFCHPFGVWDALVTQCRGFTPACVLSALRALLGVNQPVRKDSSRSSE